MTVIAFFWGIIYIINYFEKDADTSGFMIGVLCHYFSEWAIQLDQLSLLMCGATLVMQPCLFVCLTSDLIFLLW